MAFHDDPVKLGADITLTAGLQPQSLYLEDMISPLLAHAPTASLVRDTTVPLSFTWC